MKPLPKTGSVPTPSYVDGSATAALPEQLNKTLKPRWVWAIALGSAVGWGAFILPTDWLAVAGPVGAIMGFLIGAVLMSLIAVSYGFLVKTFPVSGGELAFALVGFGRKHAFFCGWFLTLAYIGIVALNASALALLFRKLLPQVAKKGYLYTVAGWDVYLAEVVIAIVVLLVFAYVNIRGAAISAKLQYIACVIMVIAVLCILAGVLFHPGSIWANASPSFPDGVPPVAAIAAIVAIAPWAYYNPVPQAAEEFNFDPQKAMKLIFLSLAAAALIYTSMIGAVAVAAPWEALVAGKSAWGTADAISGLLGGIGLMLLLIGISMGVGTGLNGFYVSASRILLAMGRAQMVPQAFSQLHPKYKTPHRGIIFVAVVCLISPWFGRAVLGWIVDMSATGITVAYIYTCLCAFRLFRWSGTASSSGEAAANSSTIRKLISLLGAIISFMFLALQLIPGSPAELSAESKIALLIWTVLGVFFYISRRKHNRALSDEQVDLLVLGKPRPQPGVTNPSNPASTTL